MTERASRPSPEVYLMKKEVEKVRNEVKQERAIYDHHKNNLEKRYQDEVRNICINMLVRICTNIKIIMIQVKNNQLSGRGE